MACKKLIIILALLALLLAAPVSAVNMSISDLGYGPSMDVLIYAPDGTLAGQWNTTSTGIPLPASDFNLVIKPATSNPLSDPGQFMQDALAWMQTNIIGILVLMSSIGLLLRKW